ncbi:MAG: hypothetical protein ACJAYU_003779 [Bradymonadia bacterium]|jgi:hypothetical protein
MLGWEEVTKRDRQWVQDNPRTVPNAVFAREPSRMQAFMKS